MARRKRLLSGLGLAASLLLPASPAPAVPVAYSLSEDFGDPIGVLSASVTFDVVGGNLQVTLTNTATADVLIPRQVLTALFFSIAGGPALARSSAVVAPGSAVHFGPTDPGAVVGGEWAYRSGLSGLPLGATQGISSAGFGLFDQDYRFPGSNLQGPAAPDGLQYGITSDGDDMTTGNRAVTGGDGGNSVALIKNSVVFALGDLPEGFQLTDISSVSFQYGTDLSDPQLVTPEPTTLLLWGTTAAGLGLAAWRRRRRP